MKATIEQHDLSYRIDLSKPLDLSIPLRGDAQNLVAWGLEHPRITAHTDGDFIGKVSEGSAVNFNDIWFNPHAHCTHTECVGHITEEFHSIDQSLNQYFFFAELISITPELKDDDWVVSKSIFETAFEKVSPSSGNMPSALVVRTLPNDRKKRSRQYSGTNPPYLLEEAMQFLVDSGIEHLLIDLPSVDKENDGGRLLAHKAFWDFDGQLRQQATITELIYVPDGIKDGSYFLNLQVAAFENDASPSRPVFYKILEK